MTPQARFAAAIDCLAAIAETPRPADAVIGAFFKANRYMGAKDRTAVAETVYGVLRRHARLHWWLDHLKTTEAGPRALAIVNQVLGEQRPPASVAALFAGARYAPAPMTTAEAQLLRQLEGRTLIHPAMPDAVRIECPAWAETSLRRDLGDRFDPELGALLDPAPLDIRVNPIKTDPLKVLSTLGEAGIEAKPSIWSPVGIRVTGRPPVTTLQAFRDGWFEIQDEGSQLVALLCDARPGHQVVDFCAGAGGKALALAATMANKGRVIACDVLENRLKRAAERLRRAGIHNVETRVLSSARDPWVKRHKRSFDRVLVDAPCTGVGTWRRNPDARWRRLGPDMEELQALQAEILDSAARLVRPGGRLIYATCSLLAEENENQVAAFLATHGEFRLRPAIDLWPTVVGAPCPVTGDFLALSPARHDTDGFFAAVLERCSETGPVSVEARDES